MTNPNTASPVTRSAEVQQAMDWLLDQGEASGINEAVAVRKHIEQLEASQTKHDLSKPLHAEVTAEIEAMQKGTYQMVRPKPQSDEVLAEYYKAYDFIYALMDKLESCGAWDAVKHIHHLVSSAYGNMQTPSSLAALSRQAPVPTSGHEWEQREGYSFTSCNKCGIVRRADDKNSPCKGPVKVTLREEGVPTSGAVEVAREILWKSSVPGVELTETHVVAIIQQYGINERAKGQEDYRVASIAVVAAALATQSPAADGKPPMSEVIPLASCNTFARCYTYLGDATFGDAEYDEKFLRHVWDLAQSMVVPADGKLEALDDIACFVKDRISAGDISKQHGTTILTWCQRGER